MPPSWTTPHGVHLVGSIPLADNDEVCRFVARHLADHVRRVPDGETGERKDWIEWQCRRLRDSPQLEEIAYEEHAEHYDLPKFQIRDSYGADQIELPELGYARAAIDSWEVFARRRSEGLLPVPVRFQVSLPTPLATTAAYVMPDDQEAFETAYRDKLLGELDKILSVVPHDEIAVQWDTAVEFALLEGVWPSFLDDVAEGIDRRLVELAEHVPEPAELGYHLCYGDRDHRHFTEPDDASELVRVANAVAEGVDRSIQWMHMPVPRERTDEAFVRPMGQLELPDNTELYVGLVHYTDGVEGTRERIQAASRYLDEFGVATECGWGRRAPETLDVLASIHTAVAEPVRGRPTSRSRPRP